MTILTQINFGGRPIFYDLQLDFIPRVGEIINFSTIHPKYKEAINKALVVDSKAFVFRVIQVEHLIYPGENYHMIVIYIGMIDLLEKVATQEEINK